MFQLDLSASLAFFYLILGVFQLNLALFARRKYKGKALENITRVLYLLGLAYFVTGAFLTGLSSAAVPAPFRLAGLIIGIFALAVMTWSFVTLGTSAFVPGKTVIDKGPFGTVRHPIYSSLVLFIFALALIFNSVITCVYAILAGAFFYQLSLYEESELKELHGKKYDDYKKRVGAVFPKVR